MVSGAMDVGAVVSDGEPRGSLSSRLRGGGRDSTSWLCGQQGVEWWEAPVVPRSGVDGQALTEMLIGTPLVAGECPSESFSLSRAGVDGACGCRLLLGVVVVGLVMPGLQLKTSVSFLGLGNSDASRCHLFWGVVVELNSLRSGLDEMLVCS